MRLFLFLLAFLIGCGSSPQATGIFKPAKGLHYQNFKGELLFLPEDKIESFEASRVDGCNEPCFFLVLKDGSMKWITLNSYGPHNEAWRTTE